MRVAAEAKWDRERAKENDLCRAEITQKDNRPNVRETTVRARRNESDSQKTRWIQDS